MNKIIKIALIASVIALLGCSAEGNPNGPRIADKSVSNPAGNDPSSGMEELLDELSGYKSSSYDDDDYEYDYDYYY
jgi:hypothetical protein